MVTKDLSSHDMEFVEGPFFWEGTSRPDAANSLLVVMEPGARSFDKAPFQAIGSVFAL